MKKKSTKSIHPTVSNLNKIQEERKLTKVAFAKMIDIPEPKWNKISNGWQDLSLWDLSNIAEKLHMSIIDIITYPEKYVKDSGKDEERVSVVFEVSPDKRDMLLQMITESK
jgi:hypothetical protein